MSHPAYMEKSHTVLIQHKISGHQQWIMRE